MAEICDDKRDLRKFRLDENEAKDKIGLQLAINILPDPTENNLGKGKNDYNDYTTLCN